MFKDKVNILKYGLIVLIPIQHCRTNVMHVQCKLTVCLDLTKSCSIIHSRVNI